MRNETNDPTSAVKPETDFEALHRNLIRTNNHYIDIINDLKRIVNRIKPMKESPCKDGSLSKDPSGVLECLQIEGAKFDDSNEELMKIKNHLQEIV